MSTRQSDSKSGDSGFTITETLVALFVFALAGVALVQMQTQSVQTFSRVESRTLAGLVADNRLVEAMARVDAPDLGLAEGNVDLGGRTWRWRLDVTPTSDPAILRIEAQAFAASAEEPSARVSAFRKTGGAR
jgi:general secretion pathway protein I